MNNFKRLLLTPIISAAALCAFAQQSDIVVNSDSVNAAGALTLSLDDCLRIALNENPTIKVADMEIERVNYAKKEVLAQLFPTLDFNTSYSRTLAKQTMYMDTGEGTMAIKVGRDNTLSTGFTAGMPVINVPLWKSIKLSENQILQNIEKARSSKLQLVNQVKNAYYALLFATDSHKVIMENYQIAKLNADIYKKKNAVGTASDYDVLRSSVEVTNLEPTILEAENTIHNLKLQLMVLMGMDVRNNITPANTLADYKDTMYEQILSINTDLVNNSNLRQLDLQTDYLAKALSAQKAQWYPTLSANFNYMWYNMNNGNPFSNMQWSSNSSVGVTLAIPLFQGGKRYYKQKQAQIAYNEMKWQRENLERSLNMQTQSQLDNLQKSIKQINTNAAGVESAKKANEIQEKSFRIGASTYLNLRDSETALLQAQLTYFQAIYNYLVAESDLELLLGNANITKYVPTQE